MHLDSELRAALIFALGIAYYFSTWPPLIILELAIAVWLLRPAPAWGLYMTAAALPFFYIHKEIGPWPWPPAEATLLVTALAYLSAGAPQARRRLRAFRGCLKGHDLPFVVTTLVVLWPSSARNRRLKSSLQTLSRQALKRAPGAWAAGALVLVGGLGWLVADASWPAWLEFRWAVLAPALFYLLLRLIDFAPTRLGEAFLIGALVVAVIGLGQYITDTDLEAVEGVYRVQSVYFSPNHVALLLERGLLLALAVALWEDGSRRRLFAIASLIIGTCLVLTFSRGAWLLALPVGLLTLGWLAGGRLRTMAVIAAVLAPALSITWLGSERLLSLTAGQRWLVWGSAWEMWRAYPWFGVGLDQFQFVYPVFQHPDAWREPLLYHAHNVVLTFLTRLGALGLAALAVLLGALFTAARRTWRCTRHPTQRALVAGLIAGHTAGLAHGLVDAYYFLPDLALYTFLTLGIWGRIGIQEQRM